MIKFFKNLYRRFFPEFPLPEPIVMGEKIIHVAEMKEEDLNAWLKNRHPARNMSAIDIIKNYPNHWEGILDIFYPSWKFRNGKPKPFDWKMM